MTVGIDKFLVIGDKLGYCRLIILGGCLPRIDELIISTFDQKLTVKLSAVCIVVIGACEALSNKLIFDQSAFGSQNSKFIAFDQ